MKEFRGNCLDPRISLRKEIGINQSYRTISFNYAQYGMSQKSCNKSLYKTNGVFVFLSVELIADRRALIYIHKGYRALLRVEKGEGS